MNHRALLVFLSVLCPATALAQAASDDVEEHLRRGYELREQGDPEAALEQFERAYRSSAEPRTAAALGLTEAKLERWRAADAHLTEALEASGDPWVQKNREHLERAREVVRKHLPDPPPDADGDAGPRQSDAASDTTSAEPPTSASAATNGERPRRVWTWVALGAGAASGVTALALRVRANDEHDRLKNECGVTRACTGEDVEKGRRLDRATQVTFALSLLGVAAAGALFFFEPRLAEGSSVEVGLGPGSAVVRGRF